MHKLMARPTNAVSLRIKAMSSCEVCVVAKQIQYAVEFWQIQYAHFVWQIKHALDLEFWQIQKAHFVWQILRPRVL